MRAFRPKSSLVKRAEYDDEQRLLTIWLSGGRRYAYADVPAEAYNALCNAASAGQHYNSQVKGRYPCREVTPGRRFRPAPDAFTR